jgi:antagonist of KipI
VKVIRVVKPGLLTTVQDLGRWGFQAHGVSVAGPMDAFSHRFANALVGNAAEVAVLEATVLGPDLEFDDDRVVAVTGGEFDVSLDGRPIECGSAFNVRRGSRLTVGRRATGTRAYIAVGGGIAVAPVLGSRATHVMTRMGGLDGRPLRAGDVLPLGDAPRESRRTENRVVFRGRAAAQVRILPGIHRRLFSDDAYRVLQRGPYRVSQDSNRVGYRLEGTAIPHDPRPDMISEATPMGTIQVPGSGMPILLMADRQTTGGYPQIATVIAADLPVAGQLGPGDAVSFVECAPKEAIAALLAREQSLLRLEQRVIP